VCANCHAERTHGFKEELEEDFPNEAWTPRTLFFSATAF
jgi:hypothetical protein